MQRGPSVAAEAVLLRSPLPRCGGRQIVRDTAALARGRDRAKLSPDWPAATRRRHHGDHHQRFLPPNCAHMHIATTEGNPHIALQRLHIRRVLADQVLNRRSASGWMSLIQVQVGKLQLCVVMSGMGGQQRSQGLPRLGVLVQVHFRARQAHSIFGVGRIFLRQITERSSAASERPAQAVTRANPSRASVSPGCFCNTSSKSRAAASY